MGTVPVPPPKPHPIMNLEFDMAHEFGDFLADGHLGNQFRSLRVESVWENIGTVTFDFTGVTNITDSFVHAFFGNMAEEHGEEFRRKVRFKGCSDLVRSFLNISVSEGLRRHRELHS